MENIIDFLVFIVFGFAGVGIMGFFKNRKAEKENEVVIKKVVEIENKNEELSNKIEDNLNQAKKKMDNLEKEKNAKKTDKELADWFNNRKPDNK